MYVCMYKPGLALDNLQKLICHKVKTNQTKPRKKKLQLLLVRKSR